MKTDYNESRKKLSDLIKSEPAKTPIQQVRPVNAKSSESEAHCNFWIPESLMKELKLHAVTSGKSIKQIGNEAIALYLSQQKDI